MKRFRLLVSFLAIVLLPHLQGDERVDSDQPTVSYQLSFEPAAGDEMPLRRAPVWKLVISGKGFDPNSGAIALVWEHWRDWKEVDSLFVELTSSTPASDGGFLPGNAMVLQQPESWNGDFEVELVYRPARDGTHAQRMSQELPVWAANYSYGQTRSLFPQVYQDHGQVLPRAKVVVTAPLEWTIASGWGGTTDSGEVFHVDPTQENGFIGFGEPVDRWTRDIGEVEIDVLQFGRATAVAEQIGERVEQLGVAMIGDLGVPIDGPIVVLVQGQQGGGSATDYGLNLSYPPDAPDWYIDSPYFHHFVAHELFHLWLGIAIDGNETITWFHEGFTEYLSLWYLASTGMIEDDWFVSRLTELGVEAEEKTVWGKRSFTDTADGWRDGDGPAETMAYKGGCILAFELDLALRKQGKPGVLELVEFLYSRESKQVTLEDLETWCASHGLEEFWKEYVSGTRVPDFRKHAAEAVQFDGFFEFKHD